MREKGVIHLLSLLVVIASVGLIAFLLITSTEPFNGTFKTLFPKPQAQADTSFFIGLNITGIAHYGYPNLFPFSNSQDIDKNLQEINRLGGKVIRIFAGNEYVSDAETAQRINLLLNKAQIYNISVIVSFIDFYGTPFRPQGTAQFYTDSWNGTPLLGREFFENGYKGGYKDFVQTVILANKQHTNIYAWEMGNELKYDVNPLLLRNFMADMSSAIKGLDQTHNVATGMINARHTNLNPADLYPYLPNVNIITVHMYDGDRAGTEDIQWANQNGKIALVEEIGYGGTGDRSNSFQQEFVYWKNLGAIGVMPWGFIAKGLPDTGNGDKVFGMDTVWHTDYDKLVNVFQNYAAPGCNPNNLQMSTTPSSVKVGETISFNASGSEGSTYTEDSWSGGVNCSGGFWGTKSCAATNAGNYTWTHSWKNCAFNNCNITSPQCSKQLNYSVNTQCTPDAVINQTQHCRAGTTEQCTYNIHTRGDCSTYEGGPYNCQNSVSCGFSTPTPTAVPTPTPSPTPTRTPTPTPSPTFTPTPTPAPIPGDIDGNRIVNIFDYNILVTNFGKTGTGIQGDLDTNGTVNIFDYNILVTNFGKTS